MAEQQATQLAQVMDKASADAAYKQRLLSQPAAVQKEAGLEPPAGVDVRVVADTDRLVHYILPLPPPGGAIAENQPANVKALVSKAWSDEAFKKRLLAQPSAVVKEAGIQVPAGVDLRVVEDTDRLVHLILPSTPSAEGELSDMDLEHVAEGAVKLEPEKAYRQQVLQEASTSRFAKFYSKKR